MSRRRKAAERLRLAADHGPAERYRHGDVIVPSPTDTAGLEGRRVMTQRVLDRYAQRDEIDGRQYAAGEALFRLWYAAGRAPKVTLNLLSVGGADDGAEARKADAWAELNRALRAVGPRLSPVLVHVCLADGTASAWARKTGHDPRGGLTALRLGLDALGDYLKLPGGGRR